MKESKECGVWTAFNRRIDTRNNNFRQEDKDDLSNLLKNILDKANIKITSNDEFYHHKIQTLDQEIDEENIFKKV